MDESALARNAPREKREGKFAGNGPVVQGFREEPEKRQGREFWNRFRPKAASGDWVVEGAPEGWICVLGDRAVRPPGSPHKKFRFSR